ncbi:MAG: hypothetical protein WB586_08215 [Chthoniobacterales bacterium]
MPLFLFLCFLACLKLSAQTSDNIVSIEGGSAQRPSTPAAFTFSRTSASGTYQALNVSYAIGASTSAVQNLDYTSAPPLISPGSVSFQAGQQNLTVWVNPQWNPYQRGARLITLDLTSTPDYQIANPSATVEILDDKPAKKSVAIYGVIVGGAADPWTSVDASMVDSMTVNGGVAAIGSSTLTRTGPNNSPLLTIIPDPGYLSGTRIPPITPNIFDVRIISSDEGLSP